MVEIVKTLSGLLNPEVLVENVYAMSVLALFLALYGPRLHTRLPPALMTLFNNPMFRAAVLFIIVYMSNRDFVGAITIVIIFSVTMNVLHTHDVLKNVGALVPNYIDAGSNVLQNSLDTSVNVVSNIGKLGLDTIDNTVDAVAATGISGGNLVANTVADMSGLVGNTLTNVNRVVTNTAQDTAHAVKKGADGVVRIVDATSDLAANTVGNVADLAADTVGGTANLVGNTISNVAGAAADTVSNLSSLATVTGNNVLNTGAYLTNEIVDLSEANIGEGTRFIDRTLNKEHFSTHGPPLSNCNSYNTGHKDANVHYPLNDNENAVNLRGGNNSVRIFDANM